MPLRRHLKPVVAAFKENMDRVLAIPFFVQWLKLTVGEFSGLAKVLPLDRTMSALSITYKRFGLTWKTKGIFRS
jgi:hypothetical protein